MTESTARPPHKCGRCPARWSGARIAHCAACHETFTTPSVFDTHLAGSKDRRFVQGVCADPVARGMVRNDRGQWGMPNDGYTFGRDE